ncbi:MAG: h [Lacunisphaera sp.]|nr:h [Lacunisphaera sp.]
MKNLRLLTGSLCLLAALAPAALVAAQSDGPKARLMAKYDTNKNGVIDGDEIAAIRAAFAAEPAGDLKKYDANKDGKLDDAEIALIKGPGGKKGETKKEKKADAPAETPKAGVKADAKEDAATTPGK